MVFGAVKTFTGSYKNLIHGKYHITNEVLHSDKYSFDTSYGEQNTSRLRRAKWYHNFEWMAGELKKNVP